MSCDDGYNLVGAKDITCEAKQGHIVGYWDKPMPICNGKYMNFSLVGETRVFSKS